MRAFPGGGMPAFPEPRLAHVGYYVRDLDKMVAFYKRVFGFVVTDHGVSTRPGSPTMAFMSRDPDEHHQIEEVGAALRSQMAFLNPVVVRAGEAQAAAWAPIAPRSVADTSQRRPFGHPVGLTRMRRPLTELTALHSAVRRSLASHQGALALAASRHFVTIRKDRARDLTF